MNKKRLKSFEKLSENEQGILIALAVIFIPIRQGYFQELLKRSGCVSADAANAIGKPLREKLLDLDLIALTKSVGGIANTISLIFCCKRQLTVQNLCSVWRVWSTVILPSCRTNLIMKKASGCCGFIFIKRKKKNF